MRSIPDGVVESAALGLALVLAPLGRAPCAETRKALARALGRHAANPLVSDLMRALGRPRMSRHARKLCRRRTRERLELLDAELLDLSADARPEAAAARTILVQDHNARTDLCRACPEPCRMAGGGAPPPIPVSA